MKAAIPLTTATQIHGDKRQNVRKAARIELGMKRFLEQGGFHAFTTSPLKIYTVCQLPGLAVQRLMQQGCGLRAKATEKPPLCFAL